jgi:hypothetical protein
MGPSPDNDRGNATLTTLAANPHSACGRAGVRGLLDGDNAMSTTDDYNERIAMSLTNTSLDPQLTFDQEASTRLGLGKLADDVLSGFSFMVAAATPEACHGYR